MSTITSKASEWLENYPAPWYVQPGLVSHTVRDLNGDAICSLPPFEWDRPVPFDVQASAAVLISAAPELLVNLARLLDVMRRTDREFTNSLDVPLATDEEWDEAIDYAAELLEQLADEGVTPGKGPEEAQGEAQGDAP